jgi:hypothetical protein
VICSKSQSKALRKRKKTSFELKGPYAFLIDGFVKRVIYRTLVSGGSVGKFGHQVGKIGICVGNVEKWKITERKKAVIPIKR